MTRIPGGATKWGVGQVDPVTGRKVLCDHYDGGSGRGEGEGRQGGRDFLWGTFVTAGEGKDYLKEKGNLLGLDCLISSHLFGSWISTASWIIQRLVSFSFDRTVTLCDDLVAD